MAEDIVAQIWEHAVDGQDLATAEGRAAADKRMKAALGDIDCPHLRNNAAALLRARRAKEYAIAPGGMSDATAEIIEELEARIAWLEKHLAPRRRRQLQRRERRF